MRRVVSLYLPDWSIDRLRRIERRFAPSADAGAGDDIQARLDAIGADAAADRAQHCSVPREGGWRPGARWARTDRAGVEAAIEALPPHRRPPQRELGRVSEAADNPFHDSSRRGLSRPAEERVSPPTPLRELSRRTEPADNPFRPGTRGWEGQDLQAAVDRLPPHQRPSLQELSRKSEVTGSPFRAMRPDEGGAPVPVRRDRHRNEAPLLHRLAAMPPVHGPGEDVVVRRAMRDARSPRRSARDGHGGEAGYHAPPNLAQLAAMPAVQFPGDGPHPDNHGKGGEGASTYGQGRFFQTGRTLGSVVARVCRDEGERRAETIVPDEPPLVIATRTGSRVEITAANPAARALGLSIGMALTMARAQVPGLAVRDADPQGDAADLAQLAETLARRWSPIVAIDGADGLLIDLTGVAHLHGGEERFARRLVRLLARHGVTARIAVADTAGAAWALARFGDRGAVQVIARGWHPETIAPLPVAALRIEPRAVELLARLGVDTVAQLAALPRAPLVRRFGTGAATRLDQAMGIASEPLDPVTLPARVSVEQRFAEPIASAEAIDHWLRDLVARLCPALAEAGQGARAIELVAARVDGVPQRLRVGFARATRDPAHMLRLTLRRIEEIAPGYGIDALALHVRRADPLGPEALGATLAGEAEPDLAPLIDALANRIGMTRLWRVTPLESDVPERALAVASPLDPPRARTPRLRIDDVRRLDGRRPDHPWHPRWPRPVRLLRRPEEVDHVMAELPDRPPLRFTWRGVRHTIVHAEGPERIAGEWWRRPAERDAVRDYFRVEDEAGERFWLYRRGDGVRPETGDHRWFLHGRGG